VTVGVEPPEVLLPLLLDPPEFDPQPDKSASMSSSAVQVTVLIQKSPSQKMTYRNQQWGRSEAIVREFSLAPFKFEASADD
jgi:hypothetical protein